MKKQMKKQKSSIAQARDSFEKELVSRYLAENKGIVRAAANASGVQYETMWNMIRRHGLEGKVNRNAASLEVKIARIEACIAGLQKRLEIMRSHQREAAE